MSVNTTSVLVDVSKKPDCEKNETEIAPVSKMVSERFDGSPDVQIDKLDPKPSPAQTRKGKVKLNLMKVDEKKYANNFDDNTTQIKIEEKKIDES